MSSSWKSATSSEGPDLWKWLLLSHLLTCFSFSLNSKYHLYRQERKKGRRKFKKYGEIDGFAHPGVLWEI